VFQDSNTEFITLALEELET